MLLKSSPVPHMGFAAVAMKNLFGSPKAPEAPKPVRMPTATDPDVEAASRRTRESALKRKGRQSTILTDQLGSVVGSSGQKLGA
jgi:hypothetical protein